MGFCPRLRFLLPPKNLHVAKKQGEIIGAGAKNSISPLESANFSSSIHPPDVKFIVGNQLTP